MLGSTSLCELARLRAREMDVGMLDMNDLFQDTFFICVLGLRKTTEIPCQTSQYPYQHTTRIVPLLQPRVTYIKSNNELN